MTELSARDVELLSDPRAPLTTLIRLGTLDPDGFMAHPLVRLHQATVPDWLFTLPDPILWVLVRSTAFPESMEDPR